MFRTEVVATKNIRKTLFFKIYNAVAILIFIAILLIISNVFGTEGTIGSFIKDNYNNLIRPGILAAALVIFLINMYVKNAAKAPKRLGTIEMDENEIKYLVDDEIKETIAISEINSIEFEFYSFRMRGNPMGGMNYLTLHKNTEVKTFEIVLANTLVKSEFGDLLKLINQTKPVQIKYAYFMKRLVGDKDFKFE